jgi:hypothetical protein
MCDQLSRNGDPVSSPKVRLTINPAESLLLMPGLNTVVNGHAGAKHFNAYPHRHPYDRIDFVASAVYEERAYDGAMAERFLALRNKVQDIAQSRKIRLDSVDLAVAGFALRLWKAHGGSDAEESLASLKQLQGKIEMYCRRAKRAAIKKEGKSLYREAAERWRRFAAWAKYHLLYFKLPNRQQPWRSRFWKEQRLQLALAITAAPREHFREVTSDADMTRVVTLLSRSLRRGRHLRSLKEVLKDPRAHTDFLVEFIEKRRLSLKTLPGAPIPAWQLYSNRADKFIAFATDRRPTAITPIPTGGVAAVAAKQERAIQNPVDSSDELRAERKIIISTENIVAELGAWFNNDVTAGFDRSVLDQAQFLIKHDLHEQDRRQTTATTMRGSIPTLSTSGQCESLR